MITKELAALLNGREYRSEMTGEEEREAKESGLVVVFGASDDLCELRGAIDEEVDCYGGGTIHLTTDAVLQSPGCGCYQSDECPYFQRAVREAKTIEAVWGKDGYSWTYKTDIPHETFDIFEDGKKYCKGIVFAVAALNDGEDSQ